MSHSRNRVLYSVKWLARLMLLTVVLLIVAGIVGREGSQATGGSTRKLGPATPGQPTQGPQHPPQPTPTHNSSNYNRPVLAFYYQWYTPSSWDAARMSDLPVDHYQSSADSTIDRQLTEAAGAGITGFITSWWGPGSSSDQNFSKLLAHAAALEQASGYHFASTIYFESDAPALQGSDKMASGLSYVIAHYGSDPHFFRWQGKPVIFIWRPLANGRTLAQWAAIRQQVDPGNALTWSAEGVNMNLLTVFDGIHLFSGGYWGLLQGNMTAVDQGFRHKIDAYNRAHHTHKIWAAGVLPGMDDTRLPGRTTPVVPRDNGANYRTSWSAAIASHPDWVTITSYNEWFEGTMIEPSIHYGTLYLDLTRQYAKKWQIAVSS
ncbi:MAG: glycoside hydrolase family 99-like domain-containing protein [Ktedonobacteraceae bacterium]|nr:glycoside hydrolase family 99-like domain-containing protein [Ktedonobacteraceae bacterium]